MTSITNLPFRTVLGEKFQCEFPLVITDELKILAEEQTSNNLKFLLESLDYLFRLHEDRIRFLSLLDIDLPEYQIQSIIEWLNFPEESSSIYGKSISSWLQFPKNEASLILICIGICCEKDEIKVSFLKEIWDATLVSLENKLGRLCHCFIIIVEKYLDRFWTEAVANFILSNLQKVENEIPERGILPLYWYHMYLGDNWAVQILSNYISNTEEEVQIPQFSWPWFSREKLEHRYAKILDAKNALTNREKKRDHLATSMEDASLSTLIPSILYARELGDTETESWLLRFVWKRKSNEGIIARISELCGFEVPKEIRYITAKDRGNWISNRLNEAMKAAQATYLQQENILSIKKIFTIQPFNDMVINALINIDGLTSDTDIQKMLARSLRKISSYIRLGKFLTKAIEVGSENATQLLLETIWKLEFYETILHSVDHVFHQRVKNDIRAMQMLMYSLDFYAEFTPEDKKNHFRLSQLNRLHKTASVVKRAYSSEGSQFFLIEKQILLLFKQRKHEEIFVLFRKEKNQSVIALETILRTSIALRSPIRILEAYNMLSSIDPFCACFYNAEVEPFIAAYNRRQKKESNGRSVVSTIWGLPANFRGGIDKQARMVGGK